VKLHAALLAFTLLFAGIACTQEIDLQAELMGPLGTQTSHKGDRVFARVVTPGFTGDTLEGKVTDAKSGGKMTGNSVLSFTFETWTHAGQAIPIASQIQQLTNSKGQVDLDEEGRVVRKSNGVLKAAGGGLLGAGIGALAGGGKGAIAGAAAGVVGSIVLIEVAAQGPNVRFEPGSKVSVSIKPRNNAALPSADTSATGATPPPAPSTPAATAPAPAAAAPVAPPAAAAQPNFTLMKDDFVPGEKTLFYDDFTDMAGDDAPPHWRVRGASMLLKSAGNLRQLTTPPSADRAFLRPNLKGLPKNFTVEADVKFETEGDNRVMWHFREKGKESGPDALFIRCDMEAPNLHIMTYVNDEQLAQVNAETDFSQPFRLRLWIQNGRLRIYHNGNRVTDVNQVELPPLEIAELEFEGYGDNPKRGMGIRMARIAESTPDFSSVISSAGRYVTHGILFDVDSDVLKSESAAVIKMVAGGLQRNPALKLAIEGHTDSTGAAARNLDLSKRRAEAVRTILVQQFQIDAARLTTNGLGDTKPLDSNDTPQGRAQNRRVEFVKQ
jgi:outer membrane protein OmpA-like peptidoglycan-associated protein